MNLRGVFPPIPTPFGGDGAVDHRALASNVAKWMRTRLSGLVVLGSNAEAPLLEDAEADAIIATVRESVPPSRTLIAGVGRESTAATIAAARRAASLGADAALVRTPSYFRNVMTGDSFVRHYSSVADASPIPILLYNVTLFTGVNLQPETVARLALHQNIIGIKESNGDLAQIAGHIAGTPEAFIVLTGSGPTFYPALAVGASGAVLALSAVLPDICMDIFDYAQKGRHAEALELQRRVTPLAKLLGAVYGVAGLKYSLDLIGYAGGPTRPPLGALPEDALKKFQDELAALGTISVKR